MPWAHYSLCNLNKVLRCKIGPTSHIEHAFANTVHNTLIWVIQTLEWFDGKLCCITTLSMLWHKAVLDILSRNTRAQVYDMGAVLEWFSVRLKQSKCEDPKAQNTADSYSLNVSLEISHSLEEAIMCICCLINTHDTDRGPFQHWC